MWKQNDIIDDTYLIMNELGRGGTGVIYLAYHMRLEKYVVLKRIKDNFTNILKVRTEVDILKKLHHTYLPQVYDFMQVDNQIYTVIDYIDGCDLDNYIKAGYVFSEEQLVLWLRQLCNVLDYLHSQKPQILHCDIKPGNIMITSAGNVCLIDFNVSLDHESKNELSGISQYYASPEQYEKAMSILYNTKTSVKIDQRTDIYSLGATFYHMISGILPTIGGANTPLSQMGLGYSQELLQIIDKMMDYNKLQRYKSVSEVVAALDRAFKKDKAQRKLAIGIVTSVVAYVAVVIVGIMMIVNGARLSDTEAFNASYSQFEEFYNAGDFESTVDCGIDILNDRSYSSVLKSNPESKAAILQYLGECYFYEEQYGEACRYYSDACRLYSKSSKNGAACIRDYAISLVRLGKVGEAETLISDAKKSGLTDDDILLVEAEIFGINGEYEKEAAAAEELFDSKEKEIRIRAYLAASNAYTALGEYEKQIECLKKVTDIHSGLLYRRRLGDAYIKYAESLNKNDISRRRSCYRSACECYEAVVENKYSIINDSLNLAVIYLELDEPQKAVSLLSEKEEDAKNSYRLHMYLAFAYEAMNDSSNAGEHCREAVRLYEKTPEKDREPRNGDSIQSLYELEKKYR